MEGHSKSLLPTLSVVPPKIRFRPRLPKPRLSYTRILAWADEYHEVYGDWPKRGDRFINPSADENWGAIDRALMVGFRGLPGGMTLARLLLKYRGRTHLFLKPDLTVKQILQWADAWHKRTGDWPKYLDGPIPKTKLTWSVVHTSLQRGAWGLPPGGSLPRLLEEHRGVKNHLDMPPLKVRLILRWADHHKAETGAYPKQNHGPVLLAPKETWSGIENALIKGTRGLPGGDSLAKFLTRHRGIRNKSFLPPLSVEDIKRWAQAYHTINDRWPTAHSGLIPHSHGETWAAVQGALYGGLRGLPGGDTLARLLAREFGRRHARNAPPLVEADIQAWARHHFTSTGHWPTALSGKVLKGDGETWAAISLAMYRGTRGLSGTQTLSALVDGLKREAAQIDD